MGCVADWRLFDPDAAKLNIDPDPPHYRNVARSMAMYGQTRRRLHSCLYVNSRLTWTCNSLYRNWLKQDTSVFHTALCDTYLLVLYEGTGKKWKKSWKNIYQLWITYGTGIDVPGTVHGKYFVIVLVTSSFFADFQKEASLSRKSALCPWAWLKKSEWYELACWDNLSLLTCASTWTLARQMYCEKNKISCI